MTKPNPILRFLAKALGAVLCFLAVHPSAHGAIVTPIYATARLNYSSGPPFNGYQFGVFDLDSPTGSLGSYQYVWTSLGAASTTAVANLAKDPASSQMYVQYGFNQYRTVGTDGTIGGTSLGSMKTAFGMSFDTAGNLNSIYSSFGSSGVFYSLNPATGGTVSSNSLSGGISIYSQFGGGLAYSADGNYYFADSPAGGLQPDGRLVRIQSDATATVIGNFAGTAYDKTKWQALFSSGPNTYLLNSSNLYLVDLSDASLDLLGNISGLPAEFSSGFSGAVGTPNAPAAVPEPGTWAAAALLASGAAFVRWRRRRA